MSYNLLKGKKGLIFGALNEDSIAWKVAERAVEEGAEIVLTNTPVSIRMEPSINWPRRAAPSSYRPTPPAYPIWRT